MELQQLTVADTAAVAATLAEESLFDALLSELFWLMIGFMTLRVLIFFGVVPRMQPGLLVLPSLRGGREREVACQRKVAIKALCAAASAGQTRDVLDLWDSEKTRGPIPLDALGDAALALAELAPERLSADLTEHLVKFRAANPQPSTSRSLVKALAEAGSPELAAELVASLRRRGVIGRLGVGASGGG